MGRREGGGRMFGGTLKRDFNPSPNEYRGSPSWEMSLHPEIRDTACARRLIYRGNRNIDKVGLGDFNKSNTEFNQAKTIFLQGVPQDTETVDDWNRE